MENTPTPIRLIALDLDGTLLNPQKQITPRTKAAIHEVQKMGIIITLATARRYGNSHHLIDELGITIPFIIYDGAMILQHPQQEILYTNPLESHIAQQVAETAIHYGLQPIIQHHSQRGEESWVTSTITDNPEAHAYLNFFPATRRVPIEELCTGQADPMRVAIFGDEETIMALAADVSCLDCTSYSIRRGNYNCAELVAMKKSCSKARSLATLAHSLDIPLEQTMAIGDNINDLEMLQEVGWGVAMGQAPTIVKEIAHAITATNAEDGVALALERYILKGTRASA